ncbi:vWA domain-containing protein [Desulfovibrio inopinatus]|uniref:vWA domain-containing protein n=1 Tax=Desulfovibrio inopinatus TaxID=102109 RepID=UPI000418F1E4|nr:VWA domain-containing protein [Desulfovibrio inopinatus]
MIEFAHPVWFVLLLVPLAVWIITVRRRRKQTGLTVTSVRPPTGMSLWLRLYRVLPIVPPFVLTLLVVALAGPHVGHDRTYVPSTGVSIVLAVDVSESMAALDFTLDGNSVNRLAAVKAVVDDFLKKRPGDRIGLVVFGSNAYTQAPLTLDHDALALALDRVSIGAAGSKTAVGDALGIALKRLEDVDSTSKVIVLLTDGRSNAGEISPESAALVAKQAGVTVHVIGVGSDKPAPFIINDPLFGQRVVHQRLEIDEPLLRSIADETGGLFFRASDTEGLRRIYDTINTLEKSDFKVMTFGDTTPLSGWFIGAAFGLMLVWMVLTATRLLSAP